jgi:hypothetical protein
MSGRQTSINAKSKEPCFSFSNACFPVSDVSTSKPRFVRTLENELKINLSSSTSSIFFSLVPSVYVINSLNGMLDCFKRYAVSSWQQQSTKENTSAKKHPPNYTQVERISQNAT